MLTKGKLWHIGCNAELLGGPGEKAKAEGQRGRGKISRRALAHRDFDGHHVGADGELPDRKAVLCELGSDLRPVS